MQRLSSQLTQLQNELAASKGIVSEKETKLTSLHAKLQDFSSSQDRLEATVKRLQSKLATSEETLREKDIALVDLDSKLQDMKASNVGLHTDIAQSSEEIENVRSQWRADTDAKSNTINELRTRTSDLVEKLQDLRLSHDKLQTTITQSSEEVKDVRAKWKTDMEAKDSMIGELQTRILDLETKTQGLRLSNDGLQATLDRSTEEARNARLQLRWEVEDHEDTSEAFRARVLDLQDDARDSSEAFQVRIADLQDMVESLQTQLASHHRAAREHNQAYIEELAELQGQVLELEEELVGVRDGANEGLKALEDEVSVWSIKALEAECWRGAIATGHRPAVVRLRRQARRRYPILESEQRATNRGGEGPAPMPGRI